MWRRVTGYVWDSFLEPWLSAWFGFGRRALLVVPVLLVGLLHFVVIGGWAGIGELGRASFLIPAIVIMISFAILYWLPRFQPVRPDILLARFVAIGEANQEAETLRNRVRDALRDSLGRSTAGDAVRVREVATILDPDADGAQKRATTLGRHYRAAVVVAAVVRRDEALSFHPVVFSPLARTYARQLPDRLERRERVLLSADAVTRDTYSSERASAISQFATLAVGVSFLNLGQPGRALEVLRAVDPPTYHSALYAGQAALIVGDDFKAAADLLTEAVRVRQTRFAMSLLLWAQIEADAKDPEIVTTFQRLSELPQDESQSPFDSAIEALVATTAAVRIASEQYDDLNRKVVAWTELREREGRETDRVIGESKAVVQDTRFVVDEMNARRLLLEGEHAKAAVAYEELLSRFELDAPDRTEITTRSALALARLGDANAATRVEQAERLATQELDEKSTHSPQRAHQGDKDKLLWWNLTEAYALIGDPAGAARNYARVGRLDPQAAYTWYSNASDDFSAVRDDATFAGLVEAFRLDAEALRDTDRTPTESD